MFSFQLPSSTDCVSEKVTELLSKLNFIRFLFAPIKEETKLLFSMFAEARLNIPGGVDFAALLLYGNNILIAYLPETKGKTVYSKRNCKKIQKRS